VKIILCFIALVGLLSLSGCAHPTARGGASDMAFSGQSTGHGSSDGLAATTAATDYRQVLASPGHF
jgi:hypothetical protein